MGVSTPIYTAIAVEYSITGMRITALKQNKTQNRIMEQKNSQVTAWIVLDVKLLPVQPVRSDSFLLRLTRI